MERNRSVILDSAKIRTLLRRNEINSLLHFEDVFFEFSNGNVQGIESAPKNAFYGKKMEIKSAKAIADFMGKDNYHTLCQPMPSKWEELLTHHLSEENFFDFITHKNSLGLIDLDFDKKGDLAQIPVSTRWSLTIHGKLDDKVLVIFRSHKDFFVLAPIDHPTSHFINLFSSDRLTIPAKPVRFDKNEGIGYREFIVVKSTYLPFKAKTKAENFYTHIEELESFAHRMFESKKKFEVCTYEFELIND